MIQLVRLESHKHFLQKMELMQKRFICLFLITWDLNLVSWLKLSDDALQILEQIVPYFQPSFNITVNLISSIGEKKDIPIVLESINYSDQYEGGFESRRTIIYTLSFTAKTYLFGPVADNPEGLIKKVDVDYYA